MPSRCPFKAFFNPSPYPFPIPLHPIQIVPICPNCPTPPFFSNLHNPYSCLHDALSMPFSKPFSTLHHTLSNPTPPRLNCPNLS
jgi:hypothetical protein